MRIGELAKKAGISVQTIRFYEQRGLLRKPPRTHAGYRIFAMQDLKLLQVIRNAQHLGFTLCEVREILQHIQIADEHSEKSPLCCCEPHQAAEIVRMCKKKMEELNRQIGNLRAARRGLLNALRQFSERSRQRTIVEVHEGSAPREPAPVPNDAT